MAIAFWRRNHIAVRRPHVGRGNSRQRKISGTVSQRNAGVGQVESLRRDCAGGEELGRVGGTEDQTEGGRRPGSAHLRVGTAITRISGGAEYAEFRRAE